jgi:hypothetical protein
MGRPAELFRLAVSGSFFCFFSKPIVEVLAKFGTGPHIFLNAMQLMPMKPRE